MRYRRSSSVLFIGLILAVAILPSALLTNRVQAPSPEAWWNMSWQYRKPVSVTSTQSLTNYDALVTTDTQSLISAGKMKADGADIRFTDSSNNQLSYWIESPTINTATTRIWVNVTSISSSGTTIWMYYGNPAATATSNGASTFSLFDDDWASMARTGINQFTQRRNLGGNPQCLIPKSSMIHRFQVVVPYQMLYDGHNVIGHAKGYATHRT